MVEAREAGVVVAERESGGVMGLAYVQGASSRRPSPLHKQSAIRSTGMCMCVLAANGET